MGRAIVVGALVFLAGCAASAAPSPPQDRASAEKACMLRAMSEETEMVLDCAEDGAGCVCRRE